MRWPVDRLLRHNVSGILPARRSGHRWGWLNPRLPFYRFRHGGAIGKGSYRRSEEHTSEIQSLMRNSYADFCLKKKKNISNRDIGLNDQKQNNTHAKWNRKYSKSDN